MHFNATYASSSAITTESIASGKSSFSVVAVQLTNTITHTFFYYGINKRDVTSQLDLYQFNRLNRGDSILPLSWLRQFISRCIQYASQACSLFASFTCFTTLIFSMFTFSCPSFKQCAAIADLFGWLSLIHWQWSLNLVSMLRFVCP